MPSLALYDPATGNSDGTARQPFANNIIPQSRISPIAQQIIKYLPQPNAPGILNNYILNVPFSYNGNSYDARVDHYFSDRTKIFGKFNTSHYSEVQRRRSRDDHRRWADCSRLYGYRVGQLDARFQSNAADRTSAWILAILASASKYSGRGSSC